jgi:hypothetical protein
MDKFLSDEEKQQLANMAEIVNIVNKNWVEWGVSACTHQRSGLGEETLF